MSESSVTSGTAASYLRFHLAEGLGPLTFARLIERFGNIDGVLAASRNELADVEGVGPKRCDSILQARDANTIIDELARAEHAGVRIMCPEDPDYPPLLKHIPDRPICLYVLGRIEPADAVSLAIVGSRRCSHYGREQANRFATSLAMAGFSVVSGMARGIDGEAHQACLDAGGRTIAVLGNGLGQIYPPEHRDLARKIASAGAVVTELPMDTAPAAENFPRRNRIIAGLTLGVLVVEAAKQSGALITGRLACEYNREVFALPGRIDVANAAGSNALIQNGQAKLVMCLNDILDEIGEVGRIMRPEVPLLPGMDSSSPPPATNLTPQEERILALLDHESVSLEFICDRSELSAGKVAASLTSLQMKGLVRQLPGTMFVRRQAGSTGSGPPGMA